MIWITWPVATLLNSIMYRLGGMGDDGAKKYGLPKWLCNTKVRDVGCSLACLIWMILHVQAAWYLHLLAFVLHFAALTTYWDKWFGEDNFYFHGFMIGMAYLPYGGWIFAVRAIVLGALMGIWCDYFQNDWVEECGRGGFIGTTLPMLLI